MILHNRRPVRAGFTLVEVMVVILIISILVALTSSILGKVRDKARQTTAITDMSQLGNAIGSFKTKLNAQFIPAFQPGTGNLGFQLASNYIDKTGALISATSHEATYLKQLFPQMNLQDNGLRDSAGNFIANGNNPPPPLLPAAGSINGPVPLDPNQTLLFFLSGSMFTNYQGFSTNRAAPFSTPSGTSVGPFIEVKAGQLLPPPSSSSALSASFQTANAPWYTDPWGNPYAYFAYDPSLTSYPTGATWPITSVPGPVNTANSLAPYGLTAYFDQTGKAIQLKGYQIICAGKNGQFGPGGTTWTPGAGNYAINSLGGDDLASFNSTPLGSQD